MRPESSPRFRLPPSSVTAGSPAAAIGAPCSRLHLRGGDFASVLAALSGLPRSILRRARVPVSAVFFTGPLEAPRAAPKRRLTVKRKADHYWPATARRGFIKSPGVPVILAECKEKGSIWTTCPITSAAIASCLLRIIDKCRAAAGHFRGHVRQRRPSLQYLKLPYWSRFSSRTIW